MIKPAVDGLENSFKKDMYKERQGLDESLTSGVSVEY